MAGGGNVDAVEGLGVGFFMTDDRQWQRPCVARIDTNGPIVARNANHTSMAKMNTQHQTAKTLSPLFEPMCTR